MTKEEVSEKVLEVMEEYLPKIGTNLKKEVSDEIVRELVDTAGLEVEDPETPESDDDTDEVVKSLNFGCGRLSGCART